MITNKSTRILRRAVGWLTLWDGYAKEDRKSGTRDNRDSEEAENIWRMAKQELGRLDRPVKLTVARYMKLIEGDNQ